MGQSFLISEVIFPNIIRLLVKKDSSFVLTPYEKNVFDLHFVTQAMDTFFVTCDDLHHIFLLIRITALNRVFFV